MPCQSEHMEPNAREAESAKVLEFLREVSGGPFDHDRPGLYYGRPSTLDADTARLCEWCQDNDVSKMSLELQLWWRNHRRADQIRERAERQLLERERLRQSAAAKLSDEERRAVGL